MGNSKSISEICKVDKSLNNIDEMVKCIITEITNMKVVSNRTDKINDLFDLLSFINNDFNIKYDEKYFYVLTIEHMYNINNEEYIHIDQYNKKNENDDIKLEQIKNKKPVQSFYFLKLIKCHAGCYHGGTYKDTGCITLNVLKNNISDRYLYDEYTSQTIASGRQMQRYSYIINNLSCDEIMTQLLIKLEILKYENINQINNFDQEIEKYINLDKNININTEMVKLINEKDNTIKQIKELSQVKISKIIDDINYNTLTNKLKLLNISISNNKFNSTYDKEQMEKKRNNLLNVTIPNINLFLDKNS
jgi:hypothetical protein